MTKPLDLPTLNHIDYSVDSQGCALVCFDRPKSAANIFDLAALSELNSILEDLESSTTIQSVIFSSSKPGIFIAGADISTLASAKGDELDTFIKMGQSLFDRIAALPMPTAAAIHGACVGGGMEMALACDIRVASDAKATKLGLPETLLGIVPAWGGSTRMPRLIGVPKALSLILAGKLVAAKYAKKIGLVDAVTPRERLEERCLQLMASPPTRKRFYLENSWPARVIAKSKARKATRAKTRGNYPALEYAIDLVCAAPGRSVEASLAGERSAVGALAELPVTKQLIRLFFLSEAAKKKRIDGVKGIKPIEYTNVIGAGVMGAGIAHWTSSRGMSVLLKDIDDTAVARGMRTVKSRFDEAVGRRLITPVEAKRAYQLVAPTAEDVPMNHIDLVIEAAVENMDIKKRIFSDLASRTREDTVLATNTSALSITELAESIKHPQRVVGIHFFNPVHRMKLVEVIYTDKTSDEVKQACLKFVQKLGKTPVLVKDSPGFLVNRILMPYLLETGHLLERGIAPRDIDEAMLDFGMPVGPVRLLDDIGLDVALHVAETMVDAFPHRMKVPQLLEKMVEAGCLGRKSGGGIYKGDNMNAELNSHIQPEGLTMSRSDIADRLSTLMVSESYRCLDERIVESPDDIDLAMILGTGWAPFRGGPMAYSKSKN